jgi:hypothetical protein
MHIVAIHEIRTRSRSGGAAEGMDLQERPFTAQSPTRTASERSACRNACYGVFLQLRRFVCQTRPSLQEP